MLNKKIYLALAVISVLASVTLLVLTIALKSLPSFVVLLCTCSAAPRCWKAYKEAE